MTYGFSFDVVIACRVGVTAAVVFNGMLLDASYLAMKGTPSEDGRHWFHYPWRVAKGRYPFYTDQEVADAIKVLVTSGLVIQGNVDGDTEWYAIADESMLN